jgi:hypothetical protein
MRPRSSTLFHFTKNEGILFDILLNGFWPRYCLEDIKWHTAKRDFIAFPMVCFCDIPLARISEHVNFYGSFGVGLTKSWAEKNNLNPIMYLSSGSELTESVKRNFQYVLKNSKDDKSALEDSRYLVAYSKPTQGKMIINGSPVEKEFYQESEWRYVPVHENVKNYFYEETILQTERMEDEHKKTREHVSLTFLPSDVAYIFVPKDSDIPNVINFMQSKLDHYPNADLKVLYSRVFSLESLNRDL